MNFSKCQRRAKTFMSTHHQYWRAVVHQAGGKERSPKKEPLLRIAIGGLRGLEVRHPADLRGVAPAPDLPVTNLFKHRYIIIDSGAHFIDGLITNEMRFLIPDRQGFCYDWRLSASRANSKYQASSEKCRNMTYAALGKPGLILMKHMIVVQPEAD
jgi:hypothetical protein